MTLKENRSFYFSVEGQTEKWYFEWLQNIINAEPASKYKVKIDVKKKSAFANKATVCHWENRYNPYM